MISRIKNFVFKVKRKIYGEYFWVGPESEVGICYDCATKELDKRKKPVRRIDPKDNYYLCKDHWEELRTCEDEEERMDVPPFLR